MCALKRPIFCILFHCSDGYPIKLLKHAEGYWRLMGLHSESKLYWVNGVSVLLAQMAVCLSVHCDWYALPLYCSLACQMVLFLNVLQMTDIFMSSWVVLNHTHSGTVTVMLLLIISHLSLSPFCLRTSYQNNDLASKALVEFLTFVIQNKWFNE